MAALGSIVTRSNVAGENKIVITKEVVPLLRETPHIHSINFKIMTADNVHCDQILFSHPELNKIYVKDMMDRA